MNNEKIFENPCAVCRRKEATQLCDYPIKFNRQIIFVRGWPEFRDANSRPNDETCDLPLCSDCAYEENRADLCPHHTALHRQAQLPNKYRRAQAGSKAKILRQSQEEDK